MYPLKPSFGVMSDEDCPKAGRPTVTGRPIPSPLQVPGVVLVGECLCSFFFNTRLVGLCREIYINPAHLYRTSWCFRRAIWRGEYRSNPFIDRERVSDLEV